MNVAILPARIEDLPELRSISIETFSETFAAHNTAEDMAAFLSQQFAPEKLALELAHPSSNFYLLFVDGSPAGYLKLNSGAAQTETQLEEAMEIERIYVLGKYHGKKLGQALLDKALEVAIAQKKKIIWLGVWEKNEKAIAFYRKNNFEVFGSHDFVLGTDVQTDLLMKRSIS